MPPDKVGSTGARARNLACSALLEAMGEDQVIAGAGLDAEIIEIEAVRHTTGRGIGGEPEAELHGFAGMFGDVAAKTRAIAVLDAYRLWRVWIGAGRAPAPLSRASTGPTG